MVGGRAQWRRSSGRSGRSDRSRIRSGSGTAKPVAEQIVRVASIEQAFK